MQTLTKLVVAGAAGIAVVMVSMYAILSEQDRTDPLDSALVEQCRSLARQSMDLAVQAAQADPDPTDPKDAELIGKLQGDANALQGQLDELQCGENVERWVYGSFKQEMIELERYIADLQRESENAGK